MKLSMDDLKSINQKGIGRKPRKVAEKKPHTSSLIGSLAAVPLLKDAPASRLEQAPTITSLEVVDINHHLHPPQHLLHWCPLLSHSLPVPLTPFPMAKVKLPSPPPQAGPSSSGGAFLDEGEILKLRARVH